eukprot:gnl/TRDRNA2_/TRDRNA2_84916_c0_seq1.p1 gnl/TRDRNA2_/TRDRNA2_84916_c0~~gnl/TRDRNA2_/TRDRNA2_84916_c0_seq1.p1  ORF type:complete len:777 (+),score=130.75 gnl/TRDRNA2_/TRDRNA2_84916_c0_seq1:295-2331(+)
MSIDDLEAPLLTTPVGSADDDPEEGMDALLKIRSLLTPEGFGETPEPPAVQEREEALDGESIAGPDWTSRYHVVAASNPPTPLEELRGCLDPALEGALRKAGIGALFPIQAVVVPLLLRSASAACDEYSAYSCDVCVAAPTGQGKTLAYAVPLVQTLTRRLTPRPRALVVLPTRDLAMQVFRVFERLRMGLGAGVAQVRALCLVGQRSFTDEQKSLEERPPDIVVCTPGRLADHTLGSQARLDLGALRWFVIDEADRLLTQAYHRWLDVLEKVSAAPRQSIGRFGSPLQKLLFSATMTWNPQKLAMLKLRRPLYFFSSQTGKHATPAELKQHWLRCKPGAKPLAVLHLLSCIWGGELGTGGAGAEDGGRCVIFCSSVDTAHRLARLLQVCAVLIAEGAVASSAGEVDNEEAVAVVDEEGAGADDLASSEEDGAGDAETEEDVEEGDAANLSVFKGLRALPGGASSAIAEFSSNLTQRERTTLLRKFRKAQIKCLVCSDVVARGIDIPDVQAVINYSAPSYLQTYIHRVGRTARAGRTGHTFTFVRRTETKHFEQMLRKSADCWQRIRRFPLPMDARSVERQEPWYPQALKLLSRCLRFEDGGRLPQSRTLTLRDLAEEHTQTGHGRKSGEDRQPRRATHAKDESGMLQTKKHAEEPVRPRSLLDFARTLGPQMGGIAE